MRLIHACLLLAPCLMAQEMGPPRPRKSIPEATVWVLGTYLPALGLAPEPEKPLTVREKFLRYFRTNQTPAKGLAPRELGSDGSVGASFGGQRMPRLYALGSDILK